LTTGLDLALAGAFFFAAGLVLVTDLLFAAGFFLAGTAFFFAIGFFTAFFFAGALAAVPWENKLQRMQWDKTSWGCRFRENK
jgi:hypothetical protein